LNINCSGRLAVDEKTIWQRVAGLVGAKGERGLRELRTHTRRCPAGHPMAVDWSDCPYCRAHRSETGVGHVEAAPIPAPTARLPAQAAAPTLVRGRPAPPGRAPVAIAFRIRYEPDTGRYHIADESGGGGIFLNGQPIDSQGSELPDEAQIRAGDSLFILKKVPPAAPVAASAPMQGQSIAANAEESASS
jgi:hypothetical protein